jgi:cyclic pyranopterin phosphate synthase
MLDLNINPSFRDTQALFEPYQDLIAEERLLTPTIETDSTLRIKVLDRCGMTCFFCHNEGTPVAATTGFQKHRVSIYAETNDIPFTQADINGDDLTGFGHALDSLQASGLADEIHWTGGEPTLSKSLATLTELAFSKGYSVKMTSNGQSGERGLAELSQAGLTGINFSIFGTTPEELAYTQGPVFRNNLKLAEQRLNKMNEAMIAACDLGINVKANVVISSDADIDRGLRLLDQAPEQVKVRFQADTSNREPSKAAIYKLLSQLEGHPVQRNMVAGCSIDNYDYQLRDGRIATFKQTRFSRLPILCADCPIDKNGECHEGYYGVRMYKDDTDTYWLSPCIQRMGDSQPLDTFLSIEGLGGVIKSYRQNDFARLRAQYGEVYLPNKEEIAS